MEKNQMIKEVLQKMGVNVKYDEDGDLLLRFQMKYIYVAANEEQKYVSLVFPSFMEVDEDEMTSTLIVCNKMTREIKLLKVFMNQSLDSVSASCEFFYTDCSSLENSLRKALDIISVVRTLFRRTKKKLSQ